MYRISWFCFVAFGVVLLTAADSSWLLAADSSWKDEPIQKWDQEDAKQVLADSPWVQYSIPEQVRDMSPGERRDGGDWDANIGRGVGLAGTGILGPRRAAMPLRLHTSVRNSRR